MSQSINWVMFARNTCAKGKSDNRWDCLDLHGTSGFLCLCHMEKYIGFWDVRRNVGGAFLSGQNLNLNLQGFYAMNACSLHHERRKCDDIIFYIYWRRYGTNKETKKGFGHL